MNGKIINCTTGYQAFIPNNLPPKIEWTLPLINALSDADRLIGELSREGRNLPNPHLLIRPFITKEAVLSSRIEGTEATLSDVLKVDAGVENPNNPADMQEVLNYISALDYGIERLETLPLSLRLLCEVHGKLMIGVRGQHATPGEFRRSQNWIGGAGATLKTATYIPPPPDQLMSCLDSFEKFLHQDQLPPLIQIGLAHYQFEAIHPFLDGNGRVGRLLIILYLIERKILSSPLLYLSAFFETSRKEYYDNLLAVTKQGDWSTWLIYFLNGVARQSAHALHCASKINELLSTWRNQLISSRSVIVLKLVDHFAVNPFINARKASELLNISISTSIRALEQLKTLGIVEETSGGKRNKIYCAKAILDILETSLNGTSEQ